MSIDVKVPVLPESVTDATVATWYKKPGDFVKRDENLVDLETDKVVLEVPAPADGVLESIAVESGELVEANQVLGVVKEGDIPAEKTEESVAPKAPTAAPVKAPAAPAESKQSIDTGSAGPAARKMMQENNIDASQVSGSG
ncbi:MAG: biotin/lipoyl-containing protein, partial [Marinicella sp.]